MGSALHVLDLQILHINKASAGYVMRGSTEYSTGSFLSPFALLGSLQSSTLPQTDAAAALFFHGGITTRASSRGRVPV